MGGEGGSCVVRPQKSDDATAPLPVLLDDEALALRHMKVSYTMKAWVAREQLCCAPKSTIGHMPTKEAKAFVYAQPLSIVCSAHVDLPPPFLNHARNSVHGAWSAGLQLVMKMHVARTFKLEAWAREVGTAAQTASLGGLRELSHEQGPRAPTSFLWGRTSPYSAS